MFLFWWELIVTSLFKRRQGTSKVVCWIQHNVILTQRRENNWCNHNSHFQIGHHDRDKVYVQLIGSEARYELSSSLGWNHARSSSKGQTIASNPKPSHRIRCTSQHSSNRDSNWPISRGLNGFIQRQQQPDSGMWGVLPRHLKQPIMS